MIIITEKGKKYTFDVSQFILAMIILAICTFIIWLGVDFFRFPENYITTWR